jgi:hypothetical protein
LLFGIPVALDLLETLDGFLTDLTNPVGSAIGKFRMVFRLPCALGGS